MSLLLDALQRSKNRSKSRAAESTGGGDSAGLPPLDPLPQEAPAQQAPSPDDSLALTLHSIADSTPAATLAATPAVTPAVETDLVEARLTPAATPSRATEPAMQAAPAPEAAPEAAPETLQELDASEHVRGHRFLWLLVIGVGLVILASMAWQYWQVTHNAALTPAENAQPVPEAQREAVEPVMAVASEASPGAVLEGGASVKARASAPRAAQALAASSPSVNGASTAISNAQAGEAAEPATPRTAAPPTALANRPAQLVRSPAQLQLQQAWSALRQGDAARAQALYQQVLASRPGDPDATLGLAVSLHRQQQLEAAWLAYQRSLQVWPNNETARAGMLAILSESDPDTAESRLNELVQERPRDAAAQASLGGLLGRQGRWAQALGPLAMAQALAPDSIAHAHNLAVAFDQLRRNEEAVQMYRHALQLGATGTSAQAMEHRIAELQGGAVR